MTKFIQYVLLISLSLLAVGGSTVPIPATDRIVMQWIAQDSTVDNDQATLFCKPAKLASTPGASRCITPPDMTLKFVEFGITVNSAMTSAANEDCQFYLRTGAYADVPGADDEISSSLIVVGEDVDPANAAGTCESTLFILNALGEQCTRILDPTDANTTISGGGWWDISVQDGDDVVDACQAIDALSFFVVAEIQ